MSQPLSYRKKMRMSNKAPCSTDSDNAGSPAYRNDRICLRPAANAPSAREVSASSPASLSSSPSVQVRCRRVRDVSGASSERSCCARERGHVR